MRLVEAPKSWWVTLADGARAEVWATSVSEPTEGDQYFTFTVLMDASREEQWVLQVVGERPSGLERVSVAVARFPGGLVQGVVLAMAGSV